MNTSWPEVPFENLLLETKDGEWGAASSGVGLREVLIIRGTDFDDVNNPSAEFPQRWVKDHLVERKQLRAGDIILETAGGTSSQSTGRSVLLKYSFFEHHAQLPVLCASFSRHLRIKQEKYDTRFISYLLQGLYRFGYMGVFNIQHTGVSRFQFTDFKKHTKLRVPKKPTQRKIAAVLAAYDDLIEANRRRIALLERMAEEIYREWFVRLRFPGYEKNKITKGLPAGWERKRVEILASYLKRGVAPVYDDTASGLAINQKCIRNGKVDLGQARQQSREVAAERYIRRGDILVNSTGEGTLGRVAQVHFSIENCIVDSHVTIVRPAPGVPRHFLGLTLHAWEPHFATMGRGSTNQTELAPAVIGRVEVLMPSDELIKRFEALAEPLATQAHVLADGNARLQRTRDLLLPRLISGNLPVEVLAIAFPPSMAKADL